MRQASGDADFIKDGRYSFPSGSFFSPTKKTNNNLNICPNYSSYFQFSSYFYFHRPCFFVNGLFDFFDVLFDWKIEHSSP